ncbi:MAG: ligase-associated DNA damage response endonuclease PdeM [Pseudomonadota bacterium]
MSAWLSQIAKEPDEETSASIRLAGVHLVADRSGALYWPEEKMLIVADLHLEKGSSFARFRQHLPPYDTKATLRQLGRVIETYEPERVIALGDSVHDRSAWDRLDETDRSEIETFAERMRDWFWVAGNHDPDPPAGVPGRAVDSLAIGPLLFKHEPGGVIGEGQAEIAGHLHPAARVIGRGGSTRRPAFAYDQTRLILPAFGAYAGGLCLSAEPFGPLFAKTSLRAAVCGRSRVFTVPAKSILGWR